MARPDGRDVAVDGMGLVRMTEALVERSREAPAVERFARRHGDDVQVVGLGAQDDADFAREFVDEFELDQPRVEGVIGKCEPHPSAHHWFARQPLTMALAWLLCAVRHKAPRWAPATRYMAS